MPPQAICVTRTFLCPWGSRNGLIRPIRLTFFLGPNPSSPHSPLPKTMVVRVGAFVGDGTGIESTEDVCDFWAFAFVAVTRDEVDDSGVVAPAVLALLEGLGWGLVASFSRELVLVFRLPFSGVGVVAGVASAFIRSSNALFLDAVSVSTSRSGECWLAICRKISLQSGDRSCQCPQNEFGKKRKETKKLLTKCRFLAKSDRFRASSRGSYRCGRCCLIFGYFLSGWHGGHEQ